MGYIRCLGKFPAELGELKSEFEELMLQLLTVTTLTQYHELKSRKVEYPKFVQYYLLWNMG